ncbi:Fur family transcriptional regulator [Candidatus Magnetaquicoccus inordinatus]|uniref:Fur family transcriptional regulator n=1 Tax=Candidatus Magnetaquicoccus inordinatus TaxID=2496818 RepID=UPI00102BE7A6|nr:Fur family transcriptional regulator [Candidatus Magnetaquicoccus inordinatus]
MAHLPRCDSPPFPAVDHDHGRCRSWILQRAEQLCQQQGIRFTPQRQQVLAILSASHRSLGAYDILERMAESTRRPTPAAVYRALAFLMELGVVHRMSGNNAYFACTRTNHQHIMQFWICRRCGVVAETESSTIAQAIPLLAETLEFQTAWVTMEIEGECRTCRTA